VIGLSEFHALIIHLPLLGVPVLALLLVLARLDRGREVALRVEPWVFGAAAVGAVAAVVSGLAVFQHARTELRSQQWIAIAHLLVGLLLAALLVVFGWWRRRLHRRGRPPVAVERLLAVALVATVLVVVGGYLGGRMVYVYGVGVADGGSFAQTAKGAELLAAGLAKGESRVQLGKQAYQVGLACSNCHGMDAKGGSAPPLAGGISIERFRRTHGQGLFPKSVVGDRMMEAVDAWLRTLPYVPHGDG
jgi:uncharacterized membrane protein